MMLYVNNTSHIFIFKIEIFYFMVGSLKEENNFLSRDNLNIYIVTELINFINTDCKRQIGFLKSVHLNKY
jgi:hypothetical protein